MLTGFAALLASICVAAQDYPSRPIRLVVPYAPGGVSDITGRIVAAKMGELLGQPMVVENRAGAGGMLGTGAVAKAEPDGYTIVLSSLSAYAIGPRMVKAPPYDPVKDFTAIGPVALSPTILTVGPAVPFKSLKEVIDHAKANPGKLTYGSSGIGSVAHISAEMLRASTGVDLVHVPYKSAAQVTTQAPASDSSAASDSSSLAKSAAVGGAASTDGEAGQKQTRNGVAVRVTADRTVSASSRRVRSRSPEGSADRFRHQSSSRTRITLQPGPPRSSRLVGSRSCSNT